MEADGALWLLRERGAAAALPRAKLRARLRRSGAKARGPNEAVVVGRRGAEAAGDAHKSHAIAPAFESICVRRVVRVRNDCRKA